MKLPVTAARPLAARVLIAALLPVHAQDASATVSSAPDAANETSVAPASEADATPEPVPTVPVPEATPAKPNLKVREDATRLDAIEVTGSRIRRTDYETAQPIALISREDIDRTGLTSISDLLQRLPEAGSALNQAFVGFLDVGAVEVDLRNLGAKRVLVLVNGHRWVNGLGSQETNVVDLSTIPLSVIERIEVLKDGASAIYGSDAIAGVVNIITRKDVDGVDLRAYLGSYYQYRDGATQNYDASIGKNFGGTSLFLDLSLTRQAELFNADRDLTRYPIYGTGVTRGSGNTPQGKITFIPANPATAAALSAADSNACHGQVLPAGICVVTPRVGTDGQSLADYRAFDPVHDPFNFSSDFYLTSPYDQKSAFAQIAHQFGDVGLHSEMLYNVRTSNQLIAAQPLPVGDLSSFPFNTVYVSATNPYNPFLEDVGKGVGGPLTPGSGVVQRRPEEAGKRLFAQEVKTLRIGAAIDGTFDLLARPFTWELGGSYGRSRELEVSHGLFNIAHLRLALGPITDCNAAPGCVPFNIFGGQGVDGRGTITPEMLDYVTYVGVGHSQSQTKDFYLNFSTELMQMPAGPLGIALGLEKRTEDYYQNPDPLMISGESSNNQAQPTAGGYGSKEAFVELSVPVLRDAPLARELDLSLAGRYSDFGRFGSADTYKLGMRWKPFDDLLLRATGSTAFRAPSVGELFLGNSASYPGIADPCAIDQRTNTPDRTTNCATVPPQSVQVSPQLLSIFHGNPDLEPETADTLTAGMVFNPSAIPDLSFNVDWYRITVKNFINVVGEQAILNRCYDAPADQRAFCQYVHRDQTSGVLQYVENPFLNFARLKTEGVDVGLAYVLPFQAAGRFKLTLDAAYLSRYDLMIPGIGGGESKDPDSTPGRHAPGVFATFPRLKANGALAWRIGSFNASWSTRYIHHVRENCNDQLFHPTLQELGLCSEPKPVIADDPTTPNTDESNDPSQNVMKAVFLHSVQVGYDIDDWGTKIALGVNNVFDQAPPPSYGFIQNPTWEFGGGYDLPGRFGYLRVEQNF